MMCGHYPNTSIQSFFLDRGNPGCSEGFFLRTRPVFNYWALLDWTGWEHDADGGWTGIINNSRNSKGNIIQEENTWHNTKYLYPWRRDRTWDHKRGRKALNSRRAVRLWHRLDRIPAWCGSLPLKPRTHFEIRSKNFRNTGQYISVHRRWQDKTRDTWKSILLTIRFYLDEYVNLRQLNCWRSMDAAQG